MQTTISGQAAIIHAQLGSAVIGRGRGNLARSSNFERGKGGGGDRDRETGRDRGRDRETKRERQRDRQTDR